MARCSSPRWSTGTRREGRVEIVDGLAAGDEVVTAGQLKIRDGAPCRSSRRRGLSREASGTLIKRPVFATVLSLVLVLVGLVSYQRLSVREYPNIDPPVVTVETTIPAPAPRSSKARSPRSSRTRSPASRASTYITSISRQETSQITVAFSSTAIPTRPPPTCATGSGACAGGCPTRSTSRSSRRSRRTPSRSSISPSQRPALPAGGHRLRRPLRQGPAADLPGVAEVRIFGERRYAMRIWLDPERLAAYGLTPQDVEEALRRQNVEMPAGRIESAQREFTVLVRDRSAHARAVRRPDHQGRQRLSGPPGGRRPRRARRRSTSAGSCASTASRPSPSAWSSSRPPIRSTCPRRCRSCCRRSGRSLPEGMQVRVALRQLGVHRRVDQDRLPDHRRGDAAGGAGHLPVPALAPGDADSARHHPGLADRRLRAHVCLRLLHQHADAARDGAGHRPGRRRRHRHAGEHLPPHRGGDAAGQGRA